MKCICSQKDLLHALTIVQKAVNGSGILPIFENILFSAKGQKIELFATNLEISLHTSFSADIINEGRIALPAQTTLAWVSLAPDANIDIFRENGEDIHFQTSSAKTVIKGVSPDDFPEIPVVKNESSVLISSKECKRAIHEVVFSVASTGARPALSGVLCTVQNEKMILVGTDSYRLSEKKIPLLISPKSDIHCIIPAKTVMEFEKILSLEDEGDIEVVFSKNEILFSFRGISLVSRLIDGKFPPYQQIIPKSWKNEILLERQSVIRVLKRVGIFARENKNIITLTVQDSRIIITTKTTEYGTEQSEIPLTKKQEENQITVNLQYFLDVLMVLPGKEFRLRLGEKTHPLSFLYSEKDQNSEEYVHVIMPMKT